MKILKFIGGIVVAFWLLGFIFNVFGGFIHILLVIAAIVFIVDFFTNRVRADGDR